MQVNHTATLDTTSMKGYSLQNERPNTDAKYGFFIESVWATIKSPHTIVLCEYSNVNPTNKGLIEIIKMPEPLDEETEQTWIEFLNRFDQEIYPVLFEPRGYAKGESLLFWTMNRYGNDLANVLEELMNRI